MLRQIAVQAGLEFIEEKFYLGFVEELYLTDCDGVDNLGAQGPKILDGLPD